MYIHTSMLICLGYCMWCTQGCKCIHTSSRKSSSRKRRHPQETWKFATQTTNACASTTAAVLQTRSDELQASHTYVCEYIHTYISHTYLENQVTVFAAMNEIKVGNWKHTTTYKYAHVRTCNVYTYIESRAGESVEMHTCKYMTDRCTSAKECPRAHVFGLCVHTCMRAYAFCICLCTNIVYACMYTHTYMHVYTHTSQYSTTPPDNIRKDSVYKYRTGTLCVGINQTVTGLATLPSIKKITMQKRHKNAASKR